VKQPERFEKKHLHNKKLMKVYSNATIFKVYKKDSSSQKPQATVEEAPSTSMFLA